MLGPLEVTTIAWREFVSRREGRPTRLPLRGVTVPVCGGGSSGVTARFRL
ncbi:hypothetical protein LR48_Vigan04g052400 [Vigna angularis]|uniref:Uncharacterized protein n=1 Tax=Phaseolus angularis TaxID=3914 RepID=A0A0L9UC88_PHAAN|nr:hypothetical protein LR48_Vigan04g052400 [Vigna angularis]